MPFYTDDIRQSPRQSPSPTNTRLQRALDRRDRFLKRRPHLRAYQAEIDRVLDMSGDCHGRMSVLGTMMEGKLLEMSAEFKKLNQYLH